MTPQGLAALSATDAFGVAAALDGSGCGAYASGQRALLLSSGDREVASHGPVQVGWVAELVSNRAKHVARARLQLPVATRDLKFVLDANWRTKHFGNNLRLRLLRRLSGSTKRSDRAVRE